MIPRGQSVQGVVSLDDAPPPEIRATLFPGFVGDMIGAVSAYAEVPPALPAMMGLGVVATAVQRVFVVEHSPEGYRQPLNLYLLTILDSGNRKSAALSAMAAPVYEWESDKHKAAEPDLARARSERETKKARLDFLRKQYARTQDSAHLREIEDIEDGLGSVPVPPRLLTDDTTPEKLAVLLSEQGERMSVLSAEGGLFDTLAGRYAKGVPNLNLVLKAHEGEPECVDRITRETIRLLRPTVTLGLATQGEVVASMAATSAFRGRGFSARFLYAAPESKIGRRVGGISIPDTVRGAYRDGVRALLELGSENAADAEPRRITLSPGARDSWEGFSRSNERAMREGGALEHLRDWGSKLPGQVLRIAGLFHCIENASGRPEEKPISERTMAMAIHLGTLLVTHALAAFGMMGADPALEAARKVWRWIEREGKTQFTARECHQALRGSFPQRKSLDIGLAVLKERGFIVGPSSQGQGPGRRSEVYAVRAGLVPDGPPPVTHMPESILKILKTGVRGCKGSDFEDFEDESVGSDGAARETVAV